MIRKSVSPRGRMIEETSSLPAISAISSSTVITTHSREHSREHGRRFGSSPRRSCASLVCFILCLCLAWAHVSLLPFLDLRKEGFLSLRGITVNNNAVLKHRCALLFYTTSPIMVSVSRDETIALAEDHYFESLVLPSIRQNLLIPNAELNCDVMAHAYVEDSKDGGRVQSQLFALLHHAIQTVQFEHGTQEDASYVDPLVQVVVETMDDFEQARGNLIRKYTNTKLKSGKHKGKQRYYPWAITEEDHFDLTTTVRSWHSIQSIFQWMKATEELEANIHYSRVGIFPLFLTFFATPLHLYHLDPQHSINHHHYHLDGEHVILPGFAERPVNDQAVYGAVAGVQIWATERFDLIKDRARDQIDPGYTLHPQRFMKQNILPEIQHDGHPIAYDLDWCFLSIDDQGGISISDCSAESLYTQGQSTRGWHDRIDHEDQISRIVGRKCIYTKPDHSVVKCYGRIEPATTVFDATTQEQDGDTVDDEEEDLESLDSDEIESTIKNDDNTKELEQEVTYQHQVTGDDNDDDEEEEEVNLESLDSVETESTIKNYDDNKEPKEEAAYQPQVSDSDKAGDDNSVVSLAGSSPSLPYNPSERKFREYENDFEWPVVHVVQSLFPPTSSAVMSDAQLELFRHYTLPSMRSQTSQKFLWLIHVGDSEENTRLVSKLADLVRTHDNIYVIQSSLGSNGRTYTMQHRKFQARLRNATVWTGNRNRLEHAMAAATYSTWRTRSQPVPPIVTTRLNIGDALEDNHLVRIQDMTTQVFVETPKTAGTDPPMFLFWCSLRSMEWHFMQNPIMKGGNIKNMYYQKCLASGLSVTGKLPKGLNLEEPSTLRKALKDINDNGNESGCGYPDANNCLIAYEDMKIFHSRCPASDSYFTDRKFDIEQRSLEEKFVAKDQEKRALKLAERYHVSTTKEHNSLEIMNGYFNDHLCKLAADAKLVYCATQEKSTCEEDDETTKEYSWLFDKLQCNV